MEWPKSEPVPGYFDMITEQPVSEPLEPHPSQPSSSHHLSTATPSDQDESAKYIWLNVVGQGTFGVVYRAQELDTGRTVAIKKVLQDPQYSNREFKIVLQLQHPNCVKVIRHFFSTSLSGTEKYLNLVMEFVPETLNKLVSFYKKKGMAFPSALGRLYAYQLLRALAYLKGLNICHRDLKPQNVLVETESNRVILIDFGSAKALKKGETSVAYICSRYYRAPELILGQTCYSFGVDTWALGCLLAEMFLAEPLFCGKNSADQWYKIVSVMGPPTKEELDSMSLKPSLIIPNVKSIGIDKRLERLDPDFADLVKQLLKYNPNERGDPFELLLHPCFDQLRAQRLTINGKPIVNLFDFNQTEIGNHQELLPHLIPSWYSP